MNILKLVVSVFLFSLVASTGFAFQTEEDEVETKTLSVADDRIEFQYPTSWEKKEPKFNMIDAEFSIPKSEGDENSGRLTIMGAGGSVEANIDRWKGQFSQPDGGSTDDKTTVEEIEIGKNKVHMVDISGTYADRRGPVAPAVEREDYRMLAAIIETKIAGKYFVKLYGPAKTIEDNKTLFDDFVKSLKVTPAN